MNSEREQRREHYFRARDLANSDDYLAAREVLRTAVTRWPSDRPLRSFLAHVCAKLAWDNDDCLDDVEESIKHAKELCRISPDSTKASTQAINLAWSFRRGFEAIDELARFLKDHESHDHVVMAAELRNHLKESGRDPQFLEYLDRMLPQIKDLPGVL